MYAVLFDTIAVTLIVIYLMVMCGAAHADICTHHGRVRVVECINTAGAFMGVPFFIRNFVVNLMSDLLTFKLA